MGAELTGQLLFCLKNGEIVTAQTAHLLERKSRSRSIRHSSDVKAGTESCLQASLPLLFVPIFPLSELSREIMFKFR